MMLRRAFIAAMALLVASAPVFAQGNDWKKIRVAVEGAYPPFNEVGPDGKLKGFDVDVALALCAEMKAECTLVQQEWDGMIPALQAKKFDAIISSMAITDERKKSVNFTKKYASTPARFVGKAELKQDSSPAGLKGKKIGVQRSTKHERYLTLFYKDSEIVRYAKQDEVFLDLAAGRIDATFCDAVVADLSFLKKSHGKGFGFVGASIDDPQYMGEGSGIATRKADTALSMKFDEAILAIRANGTYKKIQDKYFDFDVYGK